MLLASELMKETQSYLERGRRLQGLTDAQLASKWVIDFKAWRASRSVEAPMLAALVFLTVAVVVAVCAVAIWIDGREAERVR
jgi:hypothetical protein